MIANFYNTKSDNRYLTKDLNPIPVSSTITPVPITNIIPRLTGADASVTSSSENASYPNWAAFNTDTVGSWYNPNADSAWLPDVDEPAPWIQFEVPADKYVNKVKIICGSNYGADFSCGIVISGSNDGIDYTTLKSDTITGQLGAATTCNYEFTNETYYKYIRLAFDAPLSVAYQPSLFIESINADGFEYSTVYSYDLDVIFKDDESQEDPRLILSYNPHISEANYVELNDRYYYIMGKTYSQQRIILQLHEDVLMTYRDKILKLGVILDRQENAGNPYLKDTEMPVLAKRNVQCKIFTSGFSDYTYILATTGA